MTNVKKVKDDAVLKKILEGCLAFRPHMAQTWEAIGNLPLKDNPTSSSMLDTENRHVITEKGVKEFIPNLILFSFDSEDPVPLIEELFFKKWEHRSGDVSFSNELTYPDFKILCDAFDVDPVRLFKAFVIKHPKVLFAGILAMVLSEDEVHPLLEQVGDKFIYHTKNDEKRRFYGSITAPMSIITGFGSPEMLVSMLTAGGEENLIDAQDVTGCSAVHLCVVLNNCEMLNKAILPFSPNLDLKVC